MIDGTLRYQYCKLTVLDKYECEPATPRHTKVSASSKEKIGLGQQFQVTW